MIFQAAPGKEADLDRTPVQKNQHLFPDKAVFIVLKTEFITQEYYSRTGIPPAPGDDFFILFMSGCQGKIQRPTLSQ